MPRTLLLIAGPSGSGKSRLTRLAQSSGRGVALSLDDFYRDVDEPGLPMTSLGIPDWDDAATWNCEHAIDTLRQLLATGEAEVPVYDISQSRRVGSHTVSVGAGEVLVAEGIFASQALAAARESGLAVEAIWLDRRPAANFLRRLGRDLAERRKPPLVLLRRGRALYRAEARLRRQALAAGFQPCSMRTALRRLGITRR